MTAACMIVYTFVALTGYPGYNSVVVKDIPDAASCERFKTEAVSTYTSSSLGFKTKAWCVETCK
jgi:hypothetical protein